MLHWANAPPPRHEPKRYNTKQQPDRQPRQGSLRFLGATKTTDGVLIVAGGGGGGGGGDASLIGGSGSSGNEVAGGNGADYVGKGTGGQGADGTGSGGSGGIVQSGSPPPSTDGNQGANWAVAGSVDGSGGARGGLFNDTGGGGDGYGGGGSGSLYQDSGEFYMGGGAGGSHANTQYLIGTAAFASATGANGSGGAGGTVSDPVGGESGGDGYVFIRFYIGSTTAASSPTARAVNLDFSLPEGVACSFDSVEGSLGSWIELPSASDCTITPRDGGEDPSLLGWATQEDFPVEIAQRQVDNGWGAYETYGDDGQLTGVFIPAGGYTAVTGDTNLYPIWSE